MTKKHPNIDQLDGAMEDLKEDEKYKRTEHYWKEGRLGTVYQSFLDVNELIDKSNLIEEYKIIEKEKALEARKVAFGAHYKCNPSWRF